MLRMEPDQILHDYIATELERGVDRELIISHLIENGWEQDAVLSAMDAFPPNDESSSPVSEDSELATKSEEIVPEETGTESPLVITEAEVPTEVSDESPDTEAPVQELDTTEITPELPEETPIDEQAVFEQPQSVEKDNAEKLSEATDDSSLVNEDSANSIITPEESSEAENAESPQQDVVANESPEESNETVTTKDLTEVDSIADQATVEESTATESADEPIEQEVVINDGNNNPETSDEAEVFSDTIDLNEEVVPLSEQTETSPETIIEPTAGTQAIEQPEESAQPVSQKDIEAPKPQEPATTPAQEEQPATQPTQADQAVTAETQPSVEAPVQDTAPAALETPAAPTIVAPAKKDNVVVKRIITIAISVVIVGIALLVFSIATNADTNPNNAVGTTTEPIEDINYSLTLPPDWRPDTGDISGSGLRTYSKTDGSQVYARVYVYNKVPNSLLDHVVNQVNSLKDAGIAAEQIKLSIPGAVSSQAKVLQVYKGTTATNTVNYYVYAGVDKGQVTYSIDMVIPDKYPDVINKDLGEFLAGFTPKSESLGSQIAP